IEMLMWARGRGKAPEKARSSSAVAEAEDRIAGLCELEGRAGGVAGGCERLLDEGVDAPGGAAIELLDVHGVGCGEDWRVAGAGVEQGLEAKVAACVIGDLAGPAKRLDALGVRDRRGAPWREDSIGGR